MLGFRARHRIHAHIVGRIACISVFQMRSQMDSLWKNLHGCRASADAVDDAAKGQESKQMTDTQTIECAKCKKKAELEVVSRSCDNPESCAMRPPAGWTHEQGAGWKCPECQKQHGMTQNVKDYQ